jgi:hypothetical protein
MFSYSKAIPEFRFSNQNLDCSKDRLIAQLQSYLTFKKAKGDEQGSYSLPFKTTEGLCSGLVAYWLYCKCNLEEDKFLDDLEYLLTWDHTKVGQRAKRDPKIENFINAIQFLQHDEKIRSNQVRQSALDQSFKQLLKPDDRQVSAAEINSSFVYNIEALTQLLEQGLPKNKMLRFASAYHVQGLVRSGDAYYWYDPESKDGPRKFTDVKQLAQELFDGFGKFENSKDILALNLSVYSLKLKLDPEEELAVAAQADKELAKQKGFTDNLLRDPEYKKLVLANPFMFYMALWYKNYDLADFLIQEGMDLNSKNPKGKSPIEITIFEENPSMLFKLLAEGANPDQLNFAIQKKKVDAIILLLGFGVDVPKSDLALLKSKYSFTIYHKILAKAVDLNQQLQQCPAKLDLRVATAKQVLAFLRNAKLKLQVGYEVDELKLWLGKQELSGVAAFTQIIAYCNKTSTNDLFACAQKTEILELLKYHLPYDFREDGDQELLATIDGIEKNIKNKDLTRLSKDELVEIDIILAHLNSIASHWATLYPKRLYICYQATSVKHAIERALSDNGIPDLKQKITTLQASNHEQQRNYLFFTPEPTRPAPEFLYSRDIAQLLRM